DLRPAGAAARDERVERLPPHERGIPLDEARRRRAARVEVEAVDWPLAAEFLVERVVVDIPIVKQADTAEHGCLALVVEGVRKPKAGLERPGEGRALGSIREIVRWDDGRERVSDVGRSDVVIVEHVRLIILPYTEVERMPLSRIPVVLGIDPSLRVTPSRARISAPAL